MNPRDRIRWWRYKALAEFYYWRLKLFGPAIVWTGPMLPLCGFCGERHEARWRAGSSYGSRVNPRPCQLVDAPMT